MNATAVKLNTENLENIIETAMSVNTTNAIWLFEQYLNPTAPGWDERYVVRFSDAVPGGPNEFGIVTEGMVKNNPDYYAVSDKF